VIKQDMQTSAVQLEKLGKAALINYSKELEINFNKQYTELKNDKQQPLFYEEPEQVNKSEEKSEKLEVKSHTRKKYRRKLLDPNLRRVEKIVDIPEDEKTTFSRRRCKTHSKIVRT